MKTSELIECLQRRLAKHGDRQVVVTWEGQTIPIGSRDIYFGRGINRFDEDEQIYIDADDSPYTKGELAFDPTEGEDGQ